MLGIGEPGGALVVEPRTYITNDPQMDDWEGSCSLGSCPNTPDPFVTQSTKQVKRREYSSNAPLGVRVEEKENPVMLHMEYGPVSAGPSRPCVQQC